MTLNILCNSAALFVLTLVGTGVMQGQAIMEYGAMTANSAGAAASQAAEKLPPCLSDGRELTEVSAVSWKPRRKADPSLRSVHRERSP
jgi:hypothetical protein